MKVVVLLVLVIAAPCASAQAVHKWTDSKGVVHYGDRAPSGIATEQVELEPPPPEEGVVHSRAPAQPAPVEPAPAAAQALDIVMYSRADCGYCAKARRYFAERGVPYRELDVERYAQARAEWKRLGGKGVPLFVINGAVSSGFSAGGMSARLARHGW